MPYGFNEITILRTGAATAVAAKYLAVPNAKIATICGCGNQGTISLKALMKVRALEKIYAFDIDNAKAKKFADELSEELNVAIVVADNPGAAFKESNIIVTCTPSKDFFVKSDDISAGTFIAAVGADSEDKQELEPELIGKSKLIVDMAEQCATIGELHHALKKGLMTLGDVHASLGEIITGKKQVAQQTKKSLYLTAPEQLCRTQQQVLLFMKRQLRKVLEQTLISLHNYKSYL